MTLTAFFCSTYPRTYPSITTYFNLIKIIFMKHLQRQIGVSSIDFDDAQKFIANKEEI